MGKTDIQEQINQIASDIESGYIHKFYTFDEYVFNRYWFKYLAKLVTTKRIELGKTNPESYRLFLEYFGINDEKPGFMSIAERVGQAFDSCKEETKRDINYIRIKLSLVIFSANQLAETIKSHKHCPVPTEEILKACPAAYALRVFMRKCFDNPNYYLEMKQNLYAQPKFQKI